ncbi:Origin recognition complex, subunit 3 [Globisporangium polare]
MNAAAFSTGISIRWPRGDGRTRAAANESPFAAESLSAAAPATGGSAPLTASRDNDNKDNVKSADVGKLELPRSASNAIARISKTDEESYAACQELAYQYAMEQTKSAVRTVLLKANTNCYHQVLKYFEKYMSVTTPAITPQAAATQKKSLLDDLVVFPEFHGFPTAAIVAGTDATFSEVWVNPLCQVLQRSFPLVFVVREDFQNARRVVEWMTEQLDAVKRMRESEERWLLDQIDDFDMLDTAAEKAEAYLTGRRATLRDRSTLPKSLQRASGGSEGGGARVVKQRRGAGDDDDGKDEEFVALEDDGDSDEYEDSDDGDGWKRKKRKRKTGAALSKASTTAAGVSSTYSKWTMEQLLVRIQTDLELLMGSDDPFKMWIATLQDIIDDKLDNALQNLEGDLERSLQCYNDTIEWLKKRIAACRSLPGNSGNSAAQSGMAASVNVCSIEFSLAKILHEVMTKCVAFLEAAGKATESKDTAVHHRGATDLHEARVKRERELMDRWRRRISGFLKLHEDYYQLHHFSAKQYEDDPRKPFFLICIEQLEAFNQQVLDDFLVLWTNFSRQSALERDHHRPYGTAGDIGSRMGFIVGVASSASPALRHLNLSIVSQIDMQFFSLEDSRKCFDDILEALIVDTNLPLCLSGDVMRWVAGRHRTTQSITMFLHALEFLYFTHFKHVPWSFLSHFCLEAHWMKPLQSAMAPSKRLAQWVRHSNLQNSVTMHDYLLLFSDPKLDELRKLVFPVVKPERDWLEVLLDEVSWLRQQRANWAVGWKCFRAACSWLDIELQGDEFTSYLAAALDGKLANTGKVRTIVQRLGTCSFRIATFLLDDWKVICQASAAGARTKVMTEAPSSNDCSDSNQLTSVITMLSELVLLCRFATETIKQPTTQKMLSRLRQELQNAFSDSIIVAFVQPPRARLHNSSSSQQVRQWATVTDVQTLEDRLHFNYYDRLKDLLQEIEEEGEDGGGHAGGTSWINDVSLAFLYYQESAGIYLSISEWYETFADALEDEFTANSNSTGKGKKKATTKLTKDELEGMDVETKARFLRAFCTLRHWGFVKSIGGSSSSDSDTIEKVVFI